MMSRRCGHCRRDRRVDFKPGILLWRSALCQSSEEVRGGISLYTHRSPFPHLPSVQERSIRVIWSRFVLFCLQVLPGEGTQGAPGGPVARTSDPGDAALRGAQQRPEPLYSRESQSLFL